MHEGLFPLSYEYFSPSILLKRGPIEYILVIQAVLTHSPVFGIYASLNFILCK